MDAKMSFEKNVIDQFVDTICAWVDKGQLYQHCKNSRDEYWIRVHESYVIIIYALIWTFYDTQVEVFFSRGQTKKRRRYS